MIIGEKRLHPGRRDLERRISKTTCSYRKILKWERLKANGGRRRKTPTYSEKATKDHRHRHQTLDHAKSPGRYHCRG